MNKIRLCMCGDFTLWLHGMGCPRCGPCGHELQKRSAEAQIDSGIAQCQRQSSIAAAGCMSPASGWQHRRGSLREAKVSTYAAPRHVAVTEEAVVAQSTCPATETPSISHPPMCMGFLLPTSCDSSTHDAIARVTGPRARALKRVCNNTLEELCITNDHMFALRLFGFTWTD